MKTVHCLLQVGWKILTILLTTHEKLLLHKKEVITGTHLGQDLDAGAILYVPSFVCRAFGLTFYFHNVVFRAMVTHHVWKWHLGVFLYSSILFFFFLGSLCILSSLLLPFIYLF